MMALASLAVAVEGVGREGARAGRGQWLGCGGEGRGEEAVRGGADREEDRQQQAADDDAGNGDDHGQGP